MLRPKVKSDTDDLYQTTRELLDNFNRVKTVSYAVDSSCNSESQYLTQAAIYNIVREGSELTGEEEREREREREREGIIALFIHDEKTMIFYMLMSLPPSPSLSFLTQVWIS